MIQIKPFVSFHCSAPQIQLQLQLLQTKDSHQVELQPVSWLLAPSFVPSPSQGRTAAPSPPSARFAWALGVFLGAPGTQQWGQTQGTHPPSSRFTAGSPLLTTFFFYSLLAVIIGKEGRSYKYLLKLKGACIVLAERENIREVLVLLPTPIPKCLL